MGQAKIVENFARQIPEKVLSESFPMNPSTVFLYNSGPTLLKLAGRPRERMRVGIAKTHSMRPLMKIRIAAVWLVLSGCTTTHVHWDAVQMREQVVDYYNDEIMDNLVRAVNGQPFVHVDLTGLQAIATSKLAGSAGGGETQTHTTGTNPAATAAGIVSTFSRVVTRPFTFSVNPERDENLTINSAPVIGAVPAPSTGKKPPNVYELYLQFLNLTAPGQKLCESKADLSYLSHLTACPIQKVCSLQEKLAPPPHVTGTLKSRGDCLYYVPIGYQTQYLDLFRALLTAKRPQGGTPSGSAAGPVPTFTL